MYLYIARHIIRMLGVIGMAVIVPMAISNPLFPNNLWVIYILAFFVVLNIVFNDPDECHGGD